MTPGQVRAAVIIRDGLRCVAPLVDSKATLCRDKWGELLTPRFHPNELEMDYVRNGARGDRHELVEDHVALCPGHHRGTGPTAGYVWATANRPSLRAYLVRVGRRGLVRGTDPDPGGSE